MKPLFKNTLFMLAGAYLFGLLILVIMLSLTGCSSDPAPRVIRTSNPGILKFKTAYQYLEDNIVVQLDSIGNVVCYTTEMDNRWTRPNGFTYSEQISWAKPYFTDLVLKYDFDYIRIYGCRVPIDTLAEHIIASDTILISQYVAHERSGGEQFTVELFDAWLASGNFSKYVLKLK